MRTTVFALLASGLLLVGGFVLFDGLSNDDRSPSGTTSVQPVNSVLGNASFRAVFGVSPSADTPEQFRLQTHLAYVEHVLRTRKRPTLSSSQQARRTRLLDELHAYWTAGRFPKNTEVPGRSPVFIDERGQLCAVGHLIAVSAGRSLAERVDDEYHLSLVQDMDLPALDRWAERHGFTGRELAMIQPLYCSIRPCYPPEPDEESDASPLEVTALSASVGASLLNGVLLERGTPTIVGGSAGLAGGATGLALGLRDGAAYPTASSIAGATSVLLGGWSLISALSGNEATEAEPTTATSESLSQTVRIRPTAVTAIDGTTQPGLRASIQF